MRWNVVAQDMYRGLSKVSSIPGTLESSLLRDFFEPSWVFKVPGVLGSPFLEASYAHEVLWSTDIVQSPFPMGFVKAPCCLASQSPLKCWGFAKSPSHHLYQSPSWGALQSLLKHLLRASQSFSKHWSFVKPFEVLKLGKALCGTRIN